MQFFFISILGGDLMGRWGVLTCFCFFAFLCTGRRRNLGVKKVGAILEEERKNVTNYTVCLMYFFFLGLI